MKYLQIRAELGAQTCYPQSEYVLSCKADTSPFWKYGLNFRSNNRVSERARVMFARAARGCGSNCTGLDSTTAAVTAAVASGSCLVRAPGVVHAYPHAGMHARDTCLRNCAHSPCQSEVWGTDNTRAIAFAAVRIAADRSSARVSPTERGVGVPNRTGSQGIAQRQADLGHTINYHVLVMTKKGRAYE